MPNLFGSLFNKKVKLPRTKPEELLMLMGAMYVEESNSAIENIEDLYEEELKKNDDIGSWRESKYITLKMDLVEEFCMLDMHMSGGRYKKSAKEMLSEWWDVHDKESAIGSLEWLREGGNREYFNYLYENREKLKGMEIEKIREFISSCYRKEIWIGSLEEEFGEREYSDEELVKSRFYNEMENNLAFIEGVENKMPEFGILAWDMARYVHVIRLCFIAGYLSDVECWDEINKITPICLSHFKDWDSFTKSNLIGRNFWNGTDPEDDIMTICSQLNERKTSPWKHFSWRV